MFLRSLTIRGFKSFADKTVLEFQPGVSVVVGPNGSGKSNLVDAISWVLGEQGPRALRGGHMADVIYAGSPGRAALGMAEVKLVIDNSAGLIPVPLTEIEVSRAIFRSGESEYRIGGQLVRLLDVQELLSESGIGRALHTVVGQGQLEEVLVARPEERRRYIEEAAGIAKHRKRKERAERKLSGLDQDLLRLADVLGELRRQLKPLQQQAEMATRHEQLTAEADDIALRLAGARLRDLVAERDTRRGGWDEGLQRRTAARANLDELDERVALAADDRAAAVWALQAAEGSFLDSQRSRSVAETAYRGAVDRESRARAALAEEATNAARLSGVDDEIARLDAELRSTGAALASGERELETAEATFRTSELHRREVEDERRRVSERVAARRAEMETIQRSLASYERERARLAEMLDEVRARIVATETAREGLDRDIEELDAKSNPIADRRGDLDAERRTLSHRHAEHEEIVRRNESRRDLLEARRRDIEETPGTRFLSGHRGRAIGLLGELIRAETGLERALSAALGPLSDAVVYADGETALADAADGRGAILAVASGGPVAFKLPGERSLLSGVTAEPVARGLASTVLRDVYLAGSVHEAADKHARHPKASFVTPDGVLVGPAVIHTAAAEVDERAREIRAELAVVEHDLAAAVRRRKETGSRLAEIVAEAEALAEEMHASDAEITAAAERAARLGIELEAMRREETVLVQRLGGLDDAAAAWRESLEGGEPVQLELPELPPLPEAPVKPRVTVESLRRDREAHEARLAALRAQREELAGLDPSAAREEIAAAEADRSEREGALDGAEGAERRASEARAAAAEAERVATDAEAAVNKAWRDASTELERLREQYEDEDRLRGDLERRIREGERLLRDGHQAEPTDVLGLLSAEDSVPALEKRAQLVQRRLGLLGRVNLLATGELEALQERHDFMKQELDDVKKARRDLLELVARIDEEITQTFDAAYRDVAREFEQLITSLFPGGEGRLVLTDPAEPLTSGIEIEARPGRKRVRRISLLSGGERALTAMAFLFAIFRARPSPFYFMDEVEPALDDVNLHRFLRLVEGFASDSQVLIVTHQKRTMEIAGMMYGVSMSKDGTSKVLCQRLEDGRPPAVDPPSAPAREASEQPATTPAEDPSRLSVESGEPTGVSVPQPDAVG